MKIFTITDDHLKLLAEMNVGWCHDEYGAPEIDPKRPYGNSDVPADVRGILGNEDLSDEAVRALHVETRTALQICLRTGAFATGTFECEDYSNNWNRA